MSHDDAEGQLKLEDNRLRISYGGAGRETRVKRLNKVLEQCTKALGGTFVPNPTWAANILDNTVVTVHPLGGCCMATTGQNGVVNHKGQVFAGNGTEAYEGLYVCDGSVVPTSLVSLIPIAGPKWQKANRGFDCKSF
jgi:cholesterol oxidase